MTQAASSRRTATRRAASGAATPAAGGQLSYSFSQANPRSTSGSSRLSVFWVAAAARRGTWSRFVVKMLLPRRPLRVLFASNMALQRTRRPRLRSGCSLRSLGSPLNARPLDACGKSRRASDLNRLVPHPVAASVRTHQRVFGAPPPCRRFPRRAGGSAFGLLRRAHGPLLPARGLQFFGGGSAHRGA